MTLCIRVAQGLLVSALLCTACLPLRPAQSQVEGGEAGTALGSGDELVPTGDVAYDVVSNLALQGLSTGSPGGSFSGKHRMSHAQFATAIRSLAISAARISEVGARWHPHSSPPDDWNALEREAKRIDSNENDSGPPLDYCLRVLEAIWRDPEPHGVRVPFVRDPQLPGAPTTPEIARLRQLGERQAERKFSAGELFFYTDYPPANLGCALPRMLPRRSLPAAPGQRSQQTAAAHNQRMYELLIQAPPRGYEWARDLRDLRAVFRDRRRVLLEVKERRSPAGDFQIAQSSRLMCAVPWRTEWDCRFPRATVPLDWPESPPLLHPASERAGRVASCRRAWVWGPPGSGVLYVRYAFEGTPERLFALDLPSGTILQAQSVPTSRRRPGT